MNSCILMAEIVQEPQLRYTSDNQTPVAEMLVKIPGIRDDDPPATIKVVGWGNLAQEIQAQFHEGDRVIVEGRLMMTSFDRPEGFKEKRAELTAQRVHRIAADATLTTASVTPDSPNASTPAAAAAISAPAAVSKPPASKPPASKIKAAPAETTAARVPAAPVESADYDDIPF